MFYNISSSMLDMIIQFLIMLLKVNGLPHVFSVCIHRSLWRHGMPFVSEE